MKVPLPLLLGNALSALLFLLPSYLPAQVTTTTTITLVPGWNAVWLDIDPLFTPAGQEARPASPDDIFSSHLEVITILSPQPLATTAEFFARSPSTLGLASNDGLTSFTQREWQQWNRTPQADDNLAIITGNRPYLIEATASTQVEIEGTVRFYTPEWAPDRFNLIGFALNGSPTFEAFFEASGPRHPTDRIFRLIPTSGNWTVVQDPASETMNSGEAYWIFSQGASNYMGPVAVSFEGDKSGTLNFAGPDDVQTVGDSQFDLEEITFTNLRTSGTDATPSLDLIISDGQPGDLSFRTVTPDADSATRTFLPGNLVDSTPGPTANPSALTVSGTDEDGNPIELDANTISPRSSTYLTLGAIRNWDTGGTSRTNLYRLSTGAGSIFWLPVTATLNTVQLATETLPEANAANAGLWVGEASVTEVTSFVEDGAPVRKAATPAPIRIILHANPMNDAGNVHLLSQVTLMQTKTADSSVRPEPVLVIERESIPFFEGVQERDGKRVGLRIESVAYDMPRDATVASQSDADPTDSQSDLIDMIVSESTSPSTEWSDGQNSYQTRADVDSAAIDSYLSFRGIRPPTLKENYVSALRCAGAIGAGRTVTTLPGTLVLDGFHRSNPFRHALHQRHGKGPKITREMSIIFDTEQNVPDRLTGVYQEQILGLAKQRVILEGTIKMERVSNVTQLEPAP